MKHTNEAIVIGTNHHNTLSIVRSLGCEGVSVRLLLYGDTKSYIASSRYVVSAHYFNKAADVVEYLKSQHHQEKQVVLGCSDEISHLMNQDYEELSKAYNFFNAGEKGRVTHYMDKAVQTELAESVGLSIPQTINYKTGESKPLPAPEFPCIIKPLESIHGGKHISICYNKEELETSLKEYNPNDNLLIQTFLQKEEEVVLVGLSLSDGVHIPAYIFKHRETKGGTTFSTVYPIEQFDKEIVESTKRLVEQIGYQGLFGVEFLKANGKYYFIEVNLRNDATCYSVAKAGVNLPYAYYLANIGKNYSDILTKPVCTINSMVEFPDFVFVLKRQLSLKQWHRDLKSCECRYYKDEEDIKPYKLYLKSYIKWLLGMLLKRR